MPKKKEKTIAQKLWNAYVRGKSILMIDPSGAGKSSLIKRK